MILKMKSCKLLFFLLGLLLCSTGLHAQKSKLHLRAEAELEKQQYGPASSLFLHAYRDYVAKGQLKPAVDCGIKVSQLYHRENYYQESFDLLRDIDQHIDASTESAAQQHALHYETSKERMQMYMKLHREPNAVEQLKLMTIHADSSGNEEIQNDLLYNKAIYYYTFGQNVKGNAVFKTMADKLTGSKEYDKVDKVYQTLIDNARKSNNVGMVAQSYKSYIAWRDSVGQLKRADEIGKLKKQIADNEAAIAEQDSSLSARMTMIVGLCVLAAILGGALIVGAIVLLRFIMLSRKQKKLIKMANDNNAQKAQFISNISSLLTPTLEKMDDRVPEVKALKDFSAHIQLLSQLECSSDETLEMEDTLVPSFCQELLDDIRPKVKSNVTLTVNAPKMSVPLHQVYVRHILLHLLNNAAEHTPAGGNIWLDFKKRGVHTHQFLVSNTGEPIAEERRTEVFKPFREVVDLTKGDGLGLPICKQMAVNMKGDLDIDPQFTKGTRFVLELHA